MKTKLASSIVLILAFFIASSLIMSNSDCFVRGQTIQKNITIKTSFANNTAVFFDIYVSDLKTNYPVNSVLIIDSLSGEQIFIGSGQFTAMRTPTLRIETGRFYNITVQTTGNSLAGVFYRSDNILQLMPSDVWLGQTYLNNYMEYLQVFEDAYKVLLRLD